MGLIVATYGPLGELYVKSGGLILIRSCTWCSPFLPSPPIPPPSNGKTPVGLLESPYGILFPIKMIPYKLHFHRGAVFLLSRVGPPLPWLFGPGKAPEVVRSEFPPYCSSIITLYVHGDHGCPVCSTNGVLDPGFFVQDPLCTPVLRTIGNMVSGTEEWADAVMTHKEFLPCLEAILQSQVRCSSPALSDGACPSPTSIFTLELRLFDRPFKAIAPNSHVPLFCLTQLEKLGRGGVLFGNILRL